MIDDHDYEVKMRAMQRFFEEGDKVKVTLRYRGAKWRIRKSAPSYWTRSKATSRKSRRSSRTRVSRAVRCDGSGAALTGFANCTP